jgi:hypothetical protein
VIIRCLITKLSGSLFANGQFSPFPVNIESSSGNVTSIKSERENHGDDVYDTSVSSLVDYFSQPGRQSQSLLYADFAYLKNLGVYPNNRLIIPRRFSSGVPNDLNLVNIPPMSTLISWVKDGEDFISVDYSEVWTNAEASYVDVLNNIGSDMKGSQEQGSNLGNFLEGAMNAVPLLVLWKEFNKRYLKNGDPK